VVLATMKYVTKEVNRPILANDSGGKFESGRRLHCV
jgi:hypothetical protein